MRVRVVIAVATGRIGGRRRLEGADVGSRQRRLWLTVVRLVQDDTVLAVQHALQRAVQVHVRHMPGADDALRRAHRALRRARLRPSLQEEHLAPVDHIRLHVLHGTYLLHIGNLHDVVIRRTPDCGGWGGQIGERFFTFQNVHGQAAEFVVSSREPD